MAVAAGVFVVLGDDGVAPGLRFAAQHGQSFRNETFTRLRPDLQTRPQCHEDFVDRAGLVLRAVCWSPRSPGRYSP